jgi:proteasome lid subunit RPN8/RPN11
MSEKIRIAADVLRAIQEHAFREGPAECCGLLSGRNGLITEWHPLRNAAPDPKTRYFAAPEDLFAAMRAVRESGRQLMGIYHSHPKAPAYPSQADVEMAFYPGVAYFIISLEPRPEVRAFRIEGRRVEEMAILIAGPEATAYEL